MTLGIRFYPPLRLWYNNSRYTPYAVTFIIGELEK